VRRPLKKRQAEYQKVNKNTREIVDKIKVVLETNAVAIGLF
jgi:hypothetical protein